MSYDKAAAKLRLGIQQTDTTKDAIIETSLNAALALAEHYCDRKFFYKIDSAEYEMVNAYTLGLYRFPVSKVELVNKSTKAIISSTEGKDYTVYNQGGMIEFKGRQYIDHMIIRYAGGYKTLPADLEAAIWGIFDNVWAQTPSNLGGAGGSSNVQSGAIDSITIADVGTVRFNNGGTSSTAASLSSRYSANPLIGPWSTILDVYHRPNC